MVLREFNIHRRIQADQCIKVIHHIFMQITIAYEIVYSSALHSWWSIIQY